MAFNNGICLKIYIYIYPDGNQENYHHQKTMQTKNTQKLFGWKILVTLPLTIDLGSFEMPFVLEKCDFFSNPKKVHIPITSL